MTQNIRHYGDVERRREREYPSVQRQLEMIWKALDEMGGGQLRPPEAQTMLDLVKFIQQKYPRQE